MRPSFTEFKRKALQNPEIQNEYNKLSPAYAFRKQLIEIRKEAGFTQEELAEILHTQKSNISRIENVNSKISPKLSTIEDYARAVGFQLEIKFKPLTD